MGIKAERLDEIISAVYDGRLLKDIMPNKIEYRVFYEMCSENAVLAKKFALAQQARAELLVEEILPIADSEDDPQRVRNRIDVRKWIASKQQPQKYGDRIDLNVNAHVDLSGALAEAAKRLLPICYPAKEVDSEIVDTIEFKPNSAADYKPDSHVKTRTEAVQKENEDEKCSDIFT